MAIVLPEVIGCMVSAFVIGFLVDGIRNAWQPMVAVVKSI